MDTKKRLDEIEKRVNAMYAGEWTCNANMPFNADVVKPRPSLSKHDVSRPTYWHMDDALFVLNARQDVLFLLDLVKQLTKGN